MLEPFLITHCAPTLASLKTANLFRLSIPMGENLDRQLSAWNAQLGEKGVSLIELKRRRREALVYVYRKARLAADLRQPGVARFLAAYGYQNTDVNDAIARLQQRLLQCDGFPHEIGLFLGYPLGDVVGFVRNAGRNCKCTGCWKVYCNECEALKTFARFEKCRDVYVRLWNQGKSVCQLTVAV